MSTTSALLGDGVLRMTSVNYFWHVDDQNVFVEDVCVCSTSRREGIGGRASPQDYWKRDAELYETSHRARLFARL